MSDTVTLTHPQLPGATYTCLEQQVPMWEASGWKRQTALRKTGADTTTSGADKPPTRKES